MAEKLQIIISAKDRFSKAFGKLQSSLPSIKRLAVASGVAIAGSTAAMAAMVKTTANTYDELSKLSDKLGFTVEGLSRLKYVGELTDVSIGQLGTAIQMMQRTTGEALFGVKEYADSVKQLGINVEDLRNLSPDQMFERYAEALAKIENPAIRTKLAMDIFGRAGGNINKMLANGIDGFRQMKQEAEDYGLVVSTKAGKAAAELNDSLTRLSGAFRGLKNKLSEYLLQPLANAFNSLSSYIASNRELIAMGLKDFAIAAFGLFETTSLAIARFVDSVNKHIENLTGVKGFAGIKKGVQDIEMWLAQNVPGLELLPREWVKRTQDSVDKYQHETHRIRQYTSEASGLKIDSPRIAEGEYESQVKAIFDKIREAFKSQGDVSKVKLDFGELGAGGINTENTKQDISTLKSLWEQYYKTEGERIAIWQEEQQKKYANHSEALFYIDQITKAKRTELSEKEKEETAAKLQAIHDLHDEHFLTEFEKLNAWYEQQKEMYANHQEELNLLKEIYAAREQEIADRQNKQRLTAQAQLLGAMANLTALFGKKGFKIAQGFSIAEATIMAYQAFNNALANTPGPPPIPEIAAAAALASGLAQVASIAAQKPPAAHGGLDYVPKEQTYLLDRGERVISPNQNKDLTDFLKSGTGGLNVQGDIVVEVNAAAPIDELSKDDWRDMVEENLIPAINDLAQSGIKIRT